MLVNQGVRTGGGPLRFWGSGITVHSVERGCLTNPGMFRNLSAGPAKVTGTNRAGYPAAYRHPGAWVMPPKAGRIGTRGSVGGSSSGDVNLAGGVNGVASSVGSSVGTATGALVSSAIASSVGSSVGTATLTGVLAAVAASTGSSVSTATLTGIGHMTPTSTGSADATVTVTATGQITASSGDAAPTDTLDVDAIAAAIWAESMTGYATPGTFGQRLRELFPQHWGIH